MSPAAQRENLAESEAPRELVERVAAALADGAIVAVPTETVYGLACRADHPEARERLARIKGRDPRQPLTWHVGRPEDLSLLDAGAHVRRLAERYWPGPLTLVLPGEPRGVNGLAKDGWTGVRCPAHEGTRSLLAGLDFPVVATSANLHGEDPLVDADAVERAFGDELALVLDGGPARLGEASTVLRVGRGKFELLRPGMVDLEALRRAAGLEIAFCCTGNTCRSPMAEGLAKGLLAERLGVPIENLGTFGFEVRSMGVFAGFGSPAADHAVAVMKSNGLDIRGHRTSTATPQSVAEADRVYCLTAGHLEALRMKLPPGASDHVELLDPEGGDVPDPIGGNLNDYQRCADHIRRCIEARLDEWA